MNAYNTVLRIGRIGVFLLLAGWIVTGSSTLLAQDNTAQTLGSAAPTSEPPSAQPAGEVTHVGGEANLKLPDLSSVTFLGIFSGRMLLFSGLIVCAFGLGFGFKMYQDLKNLPVHSSMREISDLIYETCKTYLQKQGVFIKFRSFFTRSLAKARSR